MSEVLPEGTASKWGKGADSGKKLTAHQERSRVVVEDLLPRWDQEPPMKGRGKNRQVAYGTIGDWLKICKKDLPTLERCLEQLSLSGKMGNWPYFAKCLPDWVANGNKPGRRQSTIPHTIAEGSSGKDRGYTC